MQQYKFMVNAKRDIQSIIFCQVIITSLTVLTAIKSTNCITAHIHKVKSLLEIPPALSLELNAGIEIMISTMKVIWISTGKMRVFLENKETIVNGSIFKTEL